jgi:ParB family chromosome partitioning protein
MKRRGLPVRVKMRHEAHFVEELVARHEVAVGKMVPLSSIEPNPRQPRRDMGGLEDLVASIRSKGVLEPLLVHRSPEAAQHGRMYQIIAGERRYRAAMEAGLFEVPIVELEVSPEEALEIALIENLQRKDLTAFEEADGYQSLMDRHGYTHAQIGEAVGKSRTTVTEALALRELPPPVRERLDALTTAPSKSALLEIARAKPGPEMERLLGALEKGQATRDTLRTDRRRAARTSRRTPYVFRFRAPDKRYSLALQFRQAEVDRADLIRALESVLEDLRKE